MEGKSNGERQAEEYLSGGQGLSEIVPQKKKQTSDFLCSFRDGFKYLMAFTETSDKRELKLVTLYIARSMCMRYRWVCLMS
jgi:hypothetical protein